MTLQDLSRLIGHFITCLGAGYLIGTGLSALIFKPKRWIEAVEVKKGYKWKEPTK